MRQSDRMPRLVVGSTYRNRAINESVAGPRETMKSPVHQEQQQQQIKPINPAPFDIVNVMRVALITRSFVGGGYD